LEQAAKTLARIESAGLDCRKTDNNREGPMAGIRLLGVPIAVCGPACTRWTAQIPLVVGTNRLVVTVSDRQRGGLASWRVTRN
jgi:hypothetical protein